MSDTSYPYTYACDYIRSFASFGDHGAIISRSDASQIRQGIAAAIGMSDEELARKLADYFKLHQDAIAAKTSAAFMRRFAGGVQA